MTRQSDVAALALQFTILTAARTGEVIGATWSEIDQTNAIWLIPAKRMKARREHRVPLSDAAKAVVERAAEVREHADPDAFVFPGGRVGEPLSNMAMLALLRRMERGDLTVHGFRSAFRDWCAEATNYPREVAEAALAHSLSDKVEAAYRRGDLMQKRRMLMADWGCVLLSGEALRGSAAPANARTEYSGAMRKQRVIDPADVPTIFNLDQIKVLAALAKLPPGADPAVFRDILHRAVLTYIDGARQPSQNDQRREIVRLHRLASDVVNTTTGAANAKDAKRAEALYRKRTNLGDSVASVIEQMTPAVRRTLELRASVAGCRSQAETDPFIRRIPCPHELRNLPLCGQAASDLWALIDVGGDWVLGRNRPTGRRSTTWKPRVYAPVATRKEPRREAEGLLVANLQSVVSEIMDRVVALTADSRKPGPFARFMAEVLVLVGLRLEQTLLAWRSNSLTTFTASERNYCAAHGVGLACHL